MKSQGLKKYKLPDKAGVYLFKKGKNTIYIGKATSLKDRVKSYFGKDLIQTRGPLLVDMIFHANKIDWQETDSVLEALILEASLIKKHQPKYNTKEKSDKSFLNVVITKEQLPRVFSVRSRNLTGHSDILKNVRMSKVYGPFTNGSQLKEALKIIRKIFPYLDNKSKNYNEFYRQINLVPDLADTKMYLQNIKNIKLFFQGKKKQIKINLKKEMNVFAKNKEFEKASERKRQIFALEHINDIALIKDSLEPRTSHLESNFRIEAYDIAHMSGQNMVGVMTVLEDGQVAKAEYRKFIVRTQSGANDTGALEEVLSRRFRHTEWGMPSLVVIDGSTAQLNVATRVLKRYQFAIPVVSVVKDDKHKAKAIMGDEELIKRYKKSILLANSEAHRFAITFHKLKRGKNFLNAS